MEKRPTPPPTYCSDDICALDARVDSGKAETTRKVIRIQATMAKV